MNIGKAIKALRASSCNRGSSWRDWTQAACARRAGISQTQWADAEANRKSPTLDMLTKLAAGLKVKLSRLIREAEKILD